MTKTTNLADTKQIERIRETSNDIVPEKNENWCYSTGELCDRASHEARIETAKEAILIIDELQRKLDEMTICRDKALEQPFKLAQDIVNLREEVDLANEALRCYARSDDPELAKETLIKLNASL